MALYSVWDWDRNAYAVYRTPQRVSVGDDPIPPRPSGISVLGASPDDDVKPLPVGAKLVGYDHFARGEIRRRGGALASMGAATDSSATRTLLAFVSGAIVAAGGLFWIWRKK